MDTKVFATRAEKRTKDNPHIPGVHIIGLDMGYSAPKCFYEGGNFVFPNFCQKINNEIFGKLSKSDLVYEDLATGDRYYVGEAAAKTLSNDTIVSEDSLFGRNHYLHPNFLITLRTALGLALWDVNTDGHDVFVQTGLPPEYIKRDEQFLRAAIEQEHNFRLTSGNETREFHLVITCNNVDVIYQPMGTLYSVVFDNNGNPTSAMNEYMNSNIMVFDGGFGTLDKFIIANKQIDTKTTNPNLGMKRVLEEARELIRKDYNTDISIPAMQTCLRTGMIQVNDLINFRTASYPVEAYIEKANEMVKAEAFDDIKDYVFKIKYLIMSGGTGAAWYDYFRDRLAGVETLTVVPGNSNSTLPIIYSNARGYYMYRLMQMKMQRK